MVKEVILSLYLCSKILYSEISTYKYFLSNFKTTVKIKVVEEEY